MNRGDVETAMKWVAVYAGRGVQRQQEFEAPTTNAIKAFAYHPATPKGLRLVAVRPSMAEKLKATFGAAGTLRLITAGT